MIAQTTKNGTTITFRDDGVFPTVTFENNSGAATVNLQPESADAPVTVRIHENPTVKALVLDDSGQVYPAP